MPKAESTHTPSRRALLTRQSVAAVAAAIPAATMAAPSPDAALIALCERHMANHRAYNASTFEGEFEDDPLWLAYETTREAVAGAHPQTLAGMAAKARAAVLEASWPDGSIRPEGTQGAAWAWNLVNDLLRLEGGVA